MLKVLVAAVSITSRSRTSGAASGIGDVAAAGKDQVVVDLVGDEEEVVRGQKSASARSSSRLQTRPPGLCGEQSTTMRSRPVSAAARASRSIA